MKLRIIATALLIIVLSVGIGATADAAPWRGRGWFPHPGVRFGLPVPPIPPVVVGGGYYGPGYGPGYYGPGVIVGPGYYGPRGGGYYGGYRGGYGYGYRGGYGHGYRGGYAHGGGYRGGHGYRGRR